MVWDTPERTLKGRGEILRVRQYGGKTILTYKGVSTLTQHKSREEIELELSDAEAAGMILNRLGYQPAYRYEKFRTEYIRPAEDGVVTLDETPIGSYLELEGDGEWIDRVAAELGFHLSDYVVLSYYTLYLRYCGENGIEPGGGMVYGGTLGKDT